MRDAARMLVCAVGLAGCAATAPPHGNFMGEAPAGYDWTLTEDAVTQLAKLYSPANARFDLQQSTPDAFGNMLTASLRAKGYAVQEGAVSSPGQRRTAQKGADGPSGAGVSALPLRYVLDQAGGLFRVSLLVGEQSLARAYLAQNGALHPAGAWVRKE